jgi:hypothetical protein
MVLARPTSAYIYEVRDRVTQALQPPVNVHDFVEIVLHVSRPSDSDKRPNEPADFRLTDLQPQCVQIPGGKRRHREYRRAGVPIELAIQRRAQPCADRG